MLRIKEIQESLLPLIGWQPYYDESQFKLDESLTKSESGLYYQQGHPLITLDNLRSLAPDFKKAPDADEAILFSEWLKQKTIASINKTVMRFINEKLAKNAHKNILESRSLFDGTGRIFDVVKNRKRLVGFEIVPIRSSGVTTKLNKIGLQFTEPGVYTIYIMHSSQVEPIYTLTFTKKRKNSLEWFDLDDVYLPYESSAIGSGGSWYLCYLQSELPEGSQAIRKDRDWSKGPCNSCSRAEFDIWKLWSRYLEVHPFYVTEEILDIDSNSLQGLWDIEDNQYVYDTNFGINLDITIGCDLTDFIIAQRNIFQDVLLKQFAVDALKEFVFNANARTNRHSINVAKADIIAELDGETAFLKKTGLNQQLDLAYKALELSTQGLSRVCLPCVNNGVKYRTV